jgi:hypothetical protein
MNPIYIPKDLLNIILEYDGRIKYKNGKYIDVIHIRDYRYNIITPIIIKKILIIKKTHLSNNNSFYFEFGFDIDNRIGLCYDYGFNAPDVLEICYYDLRRGWEQIRTFL